MSCKAFEGKVGDRGQRYEIRYNPKAELADNPGFTVPGEEKVFGWAPTKAGAEEMAEAWRKAPSVYDAWVVDRRPQALTVRKLIAELQKLPEADLDKIVVAAQLAPYDQGTAWENVTNVGRTTDGRICID